MDNAFIVNIPCSNPSTPRSAQFTNNIQTPPLNIAHSPRALFIQRSSLENPYHYEPYIQPLALPLQKSQKQAKRKSRKEAKKAREVAQAQAQEYARVQELARMQTQGEEADQPYIQPVSLSVVGDMRGNNDATTYRNVSAIVKEIYNSEAATNSMALDILSVYLKGQKILYIEAKSYCENRLNALMLPAIVISAASSVLSLQMSTYTYGGVIVASLAAFNSCILSLISYLKLDAKAEAHKTAAYKFDKLQSMCEFQSGKVLYFDSHAHDVANVLTHIETQVKEIKEVNQFVLPASIRRNFPIIYSTNVFSLVKMLQTDEIILTNKLKIAINDVINARNMNSPTDDLITAQNNALEILINFRNRYHSVDADFKKEINR